MKAILLIAALALPPAAGMLAAYYLRPALTRLLADLCGTEVRAELWSRITFLFLVVAPTALALMRAEHWNAMDDALDALRVMLSVAANGVLAVLLVLAWVLWRSIPETTSRAALPPPPPLDRAPGVES
jgi:hypothetical protein